MFLFQKEKTLLSKNPLEIIRKPHIVNEIPKAITLKHMVLQYVRKLIDMFDFE